MKLGKISFKRSGTFRKYYMSIFASVLIVLVVLGLSLLLFIAQYWKETNVTVLKENVATLFSLSDEAKILGTTVWFVILMDIVMTFMGSTSNDAAFQAWVTDVTVPKQRPIVETVLSVVGTVSSLAVTGVGSFAQAGTITYKVFFVGLGIVVTLCGVVGLFLIKDPPRTAEIKTSGNYWADLFYGFRPSVIKENARLYLSLAAFCFAIVAFQVFYPYLLTYVQYVIIPDNGGINGILKPSVIITAVVVAIITLVCIVTLLKLSTKKRGFCLVTGVVVLTAGFFLLSTSTSIYVILISIVPVVLGNSLVNILECLRCFHNISSDFALDKICN